MHSGPSLQIATAPKSRSIASSRARLLAVEDDPGILEVERDVLTAEGYLVETALSGEEAVRRIRGAPFDLALPDLRMPYIGGLDLLKESSAADAESPVILIT